MDSPLVSSPRKVTTQLNIHKENSGFPLGGGMTLDGGSSQNCRGFIRLKCYLDLVHLETAKFCIFPILPIFIFDENFFCFFPTLWPFHSSTFSSYISRNTLAEWWVYMSFLRKQQSRLTPAQAGIQETWIFTPFWIPACAGSDTFWTAAFAAVPLLPGFASLWSWPLEGQGRGDLLHSAT